MNFFNEFENNDGNLPIYVNIIFGIKVKIFTLKFNQLLYFKMQSVIFLFEKRNKMSCNFPSSRWQVTVQIQLPTIILAYVPL